MEKNCKAFCFAVIAAVIFFTFFGACKAEAQEVTVTSGYHSMYLGQQGGIFFENPVSQSDISIAWANGLSVGLWGSTGFDSQKNFGKEMDIMAGFSSKLGKMSYSFDGAYFVVMGGDVVNANVEIGLGPVFAKAEHYEPTHKGGPDKGSIYSAGLRFGGALNKHLGIITTHMAKYDDGAFGFHRAWLYQGGLGVSIDISSHTSLTLGSRFSIPMSGRFDDGRKREIAWNIGISRSFGR